MIQENEKKYPMFLEIIPIALFLLLSKYSNIFIATGALMVASVINIIISYLYTKTIHKIPLLTLIFVLIFGTLTLVLHDEAFIKIKVSIINIVLALILLTGFIIKKNFLKMLLSSQINLNNKGWIILNIMWIVFFIFLAVLNEIIWRHFSTDTWVNFKVFGIFIITIVFSIIQAPIISKYKYKN